MKKLTKFFIGLLAVLIVSALATPKLLSTSYVKDKIASQLKLLTGMPVTLRGGAEVSLRPYLGVSYNNVRIGNSEDSQQAPLVVIDQMKAQLSVLSALWGEAKIANLQLVRPQFNLRIDANGDGNWEESEGALTERLKTPLGETPPSLELGWVELIDGKFRLDNELTRETQTLSALNGTVNWPRINQSGELNLQAVWKGENVSIESSFDTPIDLLRGGATKGSVQIISTHLKLSYEGVISNGQEPARGDFELSTPSPNRLVEWLGYNIDAARLLGSLSVSGPMENSANGISISDAQVVVGPHTANGRLLLSQKDGALPSIVGTLAFDTVELPAVFAETSEAGDSSRVPFNLPALGGFNLDLRFSAETASKGELTISNLAAAILIRDAVGSFDIGQAETLSGTVSGSITVDSSGETAVWNSDLALMEVNLADFLQHYGDPAISLEGTGDMIILLKSEGNDSTNLLRRLNGEVTIKSKDGTLNGIDLEAILESTQERKEGVLGQLGGSTDFKSMKILALVANGIAFLRGSELTSDSLHVELGGRSDLVEKSLALRGTIKKNPTENAELTAEDVLPYFVGGTSFAPLFVPLPNSTQKPSESSNSTTDRNDGG